MPLSQPVFKVLLQLFLRLLRRQGRYPHRDCSPLPYFTFIRYTILLSIAELDTEIHIFCAITMADIVAVFFKNPLCLFPGHSKTIVRNTENEIFSLPLCPDMYIARFPVRSLGYAVHNRILHEGLKNNIDTGQLLHSFFRMALSK